MRQPRPEEMPWFVVISARTNEGEIVEILDGPFDDRDGADRAAMLHRLDGELKPYARRRYMPKRPYWVPIFGPRYVES